MNLLIRIETVNTSNITAITESAPVDFHCHGIGHYDFTDIVNLNLNDIESILAKRGHRTILTLYLFQERLNDFLTFMDKYAVAKQAGKYPHIAGIALEGPLLASHGGTPAEATWNPSKQEWQAIAACGEKGLIYNILSPDMSFDSSLKNIDSPRDIEWVCNTLLDGNVLPAPGHFVKTDPKESAAALKKLLDTVVVRGKNPTITDHFLNDMPHNFKHAWRTPEEQTHRQHDLRELELASWTLDTIEEKLGLVPALLIRYARKGAVKICQNFDGEHVDLRIVRKAIELIGAENMLLMTDSIESHILADRHLHMEAGSTLLYQENGVVAAGTQGIESQLSNMKNMGLTKQEINLIARETPSHLLQQQANNQTRNLASSF